MKTLLKWLGILATVLISLILVGAAVVYAMSNRKLSRQYSVATSWVSVANDSSVLARGEHLVRAIAKCVDCHGDNLGGTPFINSPAFGIIPAPNITRGRGGAAARYTEQDLARVIQHGVKADGRPAVVMPAENYQYLSDYDLAAIVAYVRSAPPVDSTWPLPKLGPIGRMLIVAGQPLLPATIIDHTRSNVPPAPEVDTTVEYGRHLATMGGCRSCHNEALSGGEQPGPPGPIPANLTPTGIGNWTEADFRRLLREGKGMGGRDIDNEAMPWRSSGRLTDAEIHALWLFLKSLPPKEMGQR